MQMLCATKGLRRTMQVLSMCNKGFKTYHAGAVCSKGFTLISLDMWLLLVKAGVDDAVLPGKPILRFLFFINMVWKCS